MIATYVLLVAMTVDFTGKGNSNSVTTQEFNSKATCEAAKKAYESLVSGTKTISAVCVRK